MVSRAQGFVAAAALIALLGVQLVTALAPAWSITTAAQGASPSILVIQMDDMRLDDLPTMRRTVAALGAGGISFDTFIAGGTPQCCPNRATLLTGKYPHNHGVRRNSGDPGVGGRMTFKNKGNEDRTIAVALQGAGYHTAYVGKYLNGYTGRQAEGRIPAGWDDWYAFLHDRTCAGCDERPDSEYYTYQMTRNDAIRSFETKPRDYSTRVIQRTALSIIARQRSDPAPLFLIVNPMAPHGPPVPGPGDGRKRVSQRYRSANFGKPGQGKAAWIRRLPKLTPGVRRYLDQLNRNRRRTLLAADEMAASLIAAMPPGSYVFFLSDNGFFLGEHRIAIGKVAPYKASAQVPLLVRGPEVTPGISTSVVTSSIDLAPTWADLAGIPFPDADGQSLRPLFRDGQLATPRDSVLLEWAGFTAAGLAADLDGDVLPASLLGSQGDGDSTRRESRAEADTNKNQTKKKNKKKRDRDQNRIERPNKGRFLVPPYVALRGADWLYIEWGDAAGTKEYYRYADDPHELVNVYASLPDERKLELQSRMDALDACAGAACH